MKKAIQPVEKLTINDKSYELVFDFEAIADAEELTGQTLIMGDMRQFKRPPIRLVQAMLFACLHHHHPDISYDEAKTLVSLKTLPTVWPAVIAAWLAGMRDPEEEESPKGEAVGQS